MISIKPLSNFDLDSLSNLIESIKESGFENHHVATDLTSLLEDISEFTKGKIPVIGSVFKIVQARQLKQKIALIQDDIKRLNRRHDQCYHELCMIRHELDLLSTNISEIHDRVLRVEITLIFFVALFILFFGILNKRISKVEEIVQPTNKNFIIPPIKRNLEVGMEGDDVRVIESFLQTAGYNPGKVDGKFDKDTKDAVMRLQDDLSIETDGRIGSNTMQNIRKKYEK